MNSFKPNLQKLIDEISEKHVDSDVIKSIEIHVDGLLQYHCQEFPSGAWISGPPGSGKTHIVMRIVKKYQQNDTNDQRSILAINLKGVHSTPLHFLKSILDELDYPYPKTIKTDQALKVVPKAVKELCVKAFFFDEFHQLIANQATKQACATLTIIKNLHDRCNIPIFFFSAKKSDLIMTLDDELHDRIEATFTIPPLDNKPRFIYILKSYFEHITKFETGSIRIALDYRSEAFTGAYIEAAQGSFRRLKRLLVYTLHEMEKTHSNTMQLDHFILAYKQVAGQKDNPFKQIK